MTVSEPQFFDPEFEALLREVAADPRSGLLRVQRPSMLKELFERYAPIHAQATGLTRAERHLIRVHRAEVAWLLREACLIKLIEGPRSKRFVSPYSGPGKKVELLSEGGMAREVREQHALSGEITDCADGLQLLERCVADRVGDEPEVAELAAASLRLEPTDQARLMVGIDLANRGSPRTALGLMRRVLEEGPTPADEAKVWEYVSACFVRMNDLSNALEATKSSAFHRQHPVWCTVLQLVLAFQIGMKDEVLTRSKTLDEQFSPLDPAVGWSLHMLVEQRRANDWFPTSEGAALAVSLGDRLGEIGRRIANVLA